MTERSRELIIAIDGPSGSGKSTLSRLLAERLSYLNIDTGAMYRSVALAAARSGIGADDEAGLAALCSGLDIRFRQDDDGSLRVLLDGEDVSEAIRQPEISRLTPEVARVPAVREALVRQQRRLGDAGGVVLEGRDIGSVVFPDADIKFYLFASAEERGHRRWRELRAKGLAVDLAQTVREVEERDRADMEREIAPLIRPVDAIDVDTGGLTIEGVLTRLLNEVERLRRRKGLPPLKESCHA